MHGLPLGMTKNDARAGRHREHALPLDRPGHAHLGYTFNFIDRQILVILQEPIKAELGLSDAQLGLLTGFSFALVYVTAGIPIAWLADRSNRRNIVAASLLLVLDDSLSGLIQNYGQLLAARIGVGVGEAGGSPPSPP